MDSKKDRYLEARLLSRSNGLTVQEKESVLESVLKIQSRSEGQKKGIPIRGIFASPLRKTVSAVVLLALLAVPFWLLRTQDTSRDEFQTKGLTHSAPFFSVTCLDENGRTSCRNGTRLAFRLRLEKEGRYFAVFIRKAKDGLVIWCFPADETDRSISLADLDDDGVLPQGVMLDDRYTSGQYQVFGIASTRPLLREEIRDIIEGEQETDDALQISSVFFNMN